MNHQVFLSRLVPAVVAALIVVPLHAPSSAADDVSQTRSVDGFERVRLEGAFTTEISAGQHTTKVVVSANRDLIDRVTTKVEDGTLVVGMAPGDQSFREAPKIKIALPVLRSFGNNGAGSTNITGLNGGNLEIENAGTASIVAAGRVARETITLNGTGRIDTTAVDAHDVSADSNGVGSVRVRASGSLSMNVNGIGEIRYTGNPQHVESHVNGIGHIGRL